MSLSLRLLWEQNGIGIGEDDYDVEDDDVDSGEDDYDVDEYDVDSGAQAIQHQLFYGLSSSVPPPTEYLPAKVWEYRYHLKDCYIHNHQDPSNVNEIILQALIDTIIEEANLSSVAFATSPVPKILYLDEPEPVEYSKVHILFKLLTFYSVILWGS